VPSALFFPPPLLVRGKGRGLSPFLFSPTVASFGNGWPWQGSPCLTRPDPSPWPVVPLATWSQPVGQVLSWRGWIVCFLVGVHARQDCLVTVVVLPVMVRVSRSRSSGTFDLGLGQKLSRCSTGKLFICRSSTPPQHWHTHEGGGARWLSPATDIVRAILSSSWKGATVRMDGNLPRCGEVGGAKLSWKLN
jgi:hypothetical protein